MASPPRFSPATSPSYPQHAALPNPRKRPSLHLSQSSSSAKRRRQTAASINSATSSAHPLRQTSFPPEEADAFGNEFALRSPSVDSDVTGFTGRQSATTAPKGGGGGTETAPKGKKRGRKPKKRDASGSVVSGHGPGGRDGRIGASEHDDGVSIGRGGRGARAAATSVHNEEEDEDEDEDEAQLLRGVGGGLGGANEDEDAAEEDNNVVSAERENLAVLVNAFNDDQIDRYEMYRRVKLKKEVVRRITNHVVSQSLPAGVITTIGGYTKLFVGTLIEKAREVQQQWACLDKEAEERVHNGVKREEGTRPQAQNGERSNGENKLAAETKQDLGPLLPDHFREALRRYKQDGEGGGTGLTGVSVGLGQQGAGSMRLKGKRLFK